MELTTFLKLLHLNENIYINTENGEYYETDARNKLNFKEYEVVKLEKDRMGDFHVVCRNRRNKYEH